MLGAADMFSVYIRQSLIQLHTPDEMRGRVAAVSTLAISASNELGETRSGFTAALLGPVAATVAGGIAAIRDHPDLGRLVPAVAPCPDLRASQGTAAARSDRRRRTASDLLVTSVTLTKPFEPEGDLSP